ncbi:MAG: GUN4 domain-containing protein [Thermostichales cyanobacterium SZTDM-1c_bins_54]
MQPMTWDPGTQLQSGRFAIEAILGQGGFGITYLAWDNRRLERVVIKTLNDELQGDPEFLRYQQDFLNEALRLAKCHHPHVVRVHEVFAEGELWGMVMEYIPGQTLAHLVQNQGALSVDESLHYIRQIGSALSCVHELGLLHRDVKPVNILVRRERQEAVLIDFGLSRDFAPNTLQVHTTFGTDGYAPPEQYSPVEKRGAFTDVYALAATLYTLLTGIVPLCAPVRLIGRQLDTPRRLNPGIPPAVNDCILAGMALRPEDRPQTIGEWLERLESSLNGVGALPPKPVVESAPACPQPPPSLRSHEDYLQQALQQQQWQQANDITTAWLYHSLGRQDCQGMTLQEVDAIPWQVLRQINQLWQTHSRSQFGLGTQRQIYTQANRDHERFGLQVGWYVGGQWLWEEELQFHAGAPAGHLPTGCFSGASGGLGSALLLLGRSFFSRCSKLGI